MQYHKLGTSNLVVSEVALGCAQFSNQFTKTHKTEADMIAIMHRALDLGITLWDTAPGYGEGASEIVVGKALKGRRDKVVLATKVQYGHASPEAVYDSCHASLKRLDTDYIDLLQVHWPVDSAENYMTVAAVAKLIRDGKVRCAGVSNFNAAQTEETLCVHAVGSNQLPYALVWRYDEPLIRYCGEHGVGRPGLQPAGRGHPDRPVRRDEHVSRGRRAQPLCVLPARRHAAGVEGDGGGQTRGPAARRDAGPGSHQLDRPPAAYHQRDRRQLVHSAGRAERRGRRLADGRGRPCGA